MGVGQSATRALVMEDETANSYNKAKRSAKQLRSDVINALAGVSCEQI